MSQSSFEPCMYESISSCEYFAENRIPSIAGQQPAVYRLAEHLYITNFSFTHMANTEAAKNSEAVTASRQKKLYIVLCLSDNSLSLRGDADLKDFDGGKIMICANPMGNFNLIHRAPRYWHRPKSVETVAASRDSGAESRTRSKARRDTVYVSHGHTSQSHLARDVVEANIL